MAIYRPSIATTVSTGPTGYPTCATPSTTKVARHLRVAGPHRSIRPVARAANVVLEVDWKQATDLRGQRDPIGGFDSAELGVLTGMREMLGELTGSRTRAPTPTSYRKGEITKLQPACRSACAVADILPDARRWDMSPKGSDLAGICHWGDWGDVEDSGDQDVGDSIEVHLEAVAPTRTTTDTATRTAETF